MADYEGVALGLADALSALMRQVAAEVAENYVIQVGPEPSPPAPVREEPVLVSVEKAARRIGVGTTKIRTLIATGELRSVMIDRRRLVPVQSIEEYVDRLLALH